MAVPSSDDGRWYSPIVASLKFKRADAKNKKLYDQVVKEAKKKFDVWPSVYASSWVTREYKKRGGTYKGKKPGEEEGLEKWYEEKWVDLSRPKKGGGWEECGREEQGKKDYPKCVPLAKAKKMTKKQIESAVKRKRKAEKDKPKGKKSPEYVKTLKARLLR